MTGDLAERRVVLVAGADLDALDNITVAVPVRGAHVQHQLGDKLWR